VLNVRQEEISSVKKENVHAMKMKYKKKGKHDIFGLHYQ